MSDNVSDKVIDIGDVKVTHTHIGEPEPPKKIVPVTVVGTLRDGREVQDRVELNIAQSEHDYTAAMAWIWNQYRTAGAISFREPSGKFTIYPLSSFDKLEMEFSNIVGVTL